MYGTLKNLEFVDAVLVPKVLRTPAVLLRIVGLEIILFDMFVVGYSQYVFLAVEIMLVKCVLLKQQNDNKRVHIIVY